jgi:membrane protease subunit (stomatin/prohibitin family)
MDKQITMKIPEEMYQDLKKYQQKKVTPPLLIWLEEL